MAMEKKTQSAEKSAKFFRGFKSEFKKIVWPTPKQTVNNTGIVLTMIILIGGGIFVVDTLLQKLLSLVYPA